MFLTVDIGTSSLKLGLIDSNGKLVDYGRSFFSCKSFRKFKGDDWIGAFKELSAIYRGKPVDGIAISSNGPTLLPIKKDGTALFNALFWQDGREASFEGPSYYLPKVEWFRQTHPEAYSETDLFLSPSEYLVYLMTGKASMAYSNSHFIPYLWTPEQLSTGGFSSEKFPSLVPVSSEIGRVNTQGAALFSVTEGTPCFAMGSDFQASLLGTAAVEPGVICDRAGTSEGLNYCCKKPSGYREFRDLPHSISPYWNAAAILSSTGSLFDWYRTLSGQDSRDYPSLLKKIVEEKDPTHLYFYPTLKHGGLWEFSGGMLLGLDPYHGPLSMGRAIVDSIGFSLRHGLDLLEKRLGKAKQIILCGGQAKNPHWNQLKSNLTGRSFLLPEIVDAELLGCAVAASVGLGLHSSLKEAAVKLVRIEREFHPDRNTIEDLKSKYHRYLKISRKVKSFYRKKLKIELDKN